MPELESAPQLTLNNAPDGLLPADYPRVLDDVVRLQAERLRVDPALRSLTEVVRGTPELWDQTTPFIDRRVDFRDEEKYDTPSRVFAPLLTGICRSSPELLDVALQTSEAQKSELIRNALEDAIEKGVDLFVPVIVVGSGPQSQIFNAQMQSEIPTSDLTTLTIDRETHSGGTFRPAEAMNFRLNSRTRVQTEESPKPGTRANLNDLRPGILTPGDISAEAYINAEDFGRVITVNHAFSSDLCLGMSLESFRENPASDNGQKGFISAVIRDEVSGKRYIIRTDNLVVLSGLGAEKSKEDFGNSATREIIAEESAKHEAGEKATVLTFEQLMRRLEDPKDPFPLRGCKRVAVVGPGDGGKVAVGKLLGYEPRSDSSTTQLDFVERLTWYGIGDIDLTEYVQENRLRYSQLGLEFPRDEELNRYSRISPVSYKAEDLQRSPNDQIRIIDSSGEIDDIDIFDLVVLADGYDQDNAAALQNMVAKDLSAIDISEIVDPLQTRQLEIGDTVTYAPGYSLRSIQIIAKTPEKIAAKFIRSDGTFGYFESTDEVEFRKTYLDLQAVTGKEATKEPFNFVGVATYDMFKKFTPEGKISYIQPGSIIWQANGVCNQLWRVTGEIKDGFYEVTEAFFGSEDKALTNGNLNIFVDTIIGDITNYSQGIVIAPYMFDNLDDKEASYTTLPFTKIGATKLKLGLASRSIPSGSLLRNSKKPGVVAIIQAPGDDTGFFRGFAVRADGEFENIKVGVNMLKRTIKRFGFDSFAAPPEFIGEATPENVLTLAPFLDFTPLMITDDSSERVPIAKVSSRLPVYLAGPAAQLPVDKDLVAAIPAIPENTVSLFASAERVRALATLVASDVRRSQRLTGPDEELSVTRSPRKPTIIGRRDKNGKLLLTAGPSEFTITSRTRQFEPELPTVRQSQAVRLVLGSLSRQANFRTETFDNQTVSIKVSPGPKGTFVCSLSSEDSSRISKYMTQRGAFVDYLIGDPLVADFIRKQFKVHPALTFGLRFDERGLDIRATEITPQRTSRSRTAELPSSSKK